MANLDCNTGVTEEEYGGAVEEVGVIWCSSKAMGEGVPVAESTKVDAALEYDIPQPINESSLAEEEVNPEPRTTSTVTYEVVVSGTKKAGNYLLTTVVTRLT